MRRYIITIIIAAIILSNTATATDNVPFNNLEIDAQTLEMIKGQINSQDPDNQALQTIKDTFGDEILEITLSETNQTFTITTQNGNLTNITIGSDPKATMKLKINETLIEELQNLQNSEDPAQIILDALNSDKIEYEATKEASFRTKLMLFFSKIALKAATFLKWIISIF